MQSRISRTNEPIPEVFDVSDAKNDIGLSSKLTRPLGAHGQLEGLSLLNATSHRLTSDGRNSIGAAPSGRESSPTHVSIFGFGSDVTLERKLSILTDAPHPYRVTGHVGYSLDDGKTIFGFGPCVPDSANPTDTIARLLKRETFPGKVSDDTQIFKSVAENPHHSESTATIGQYVYKHDIPVSREQFLAIKSEHDARPLGQKMPDIRYGFPFPNTSAFNCATYPSSLGVKIPHPRGTLSTYIPKLADNGSKWVPENTLTSMPPSGSEVSPAHVSIFGFGSDVTLERKLSILTDAPHPYRVTGHVGYSLDDGKTIFGFGPCVPDSANPTDTIARLLKRETFPGKVSDDTQIFKSVAENPHHSESTATIGQYVYKHDIPVSREQFLAIKSEHDARPLGQKMPDIRYGFPFPNTSAFNCATYPSSLGVKIPHPRGTLSTYIPKLADNGSKWVPESDEPTYVLLKC